MLNSISLTGSYAGIAERDLVAHCIYSKTWFSYAAKYLHHSRQHCLAPVHLTVALRQLGNEILH